MWWVSVCQEQCSFSDWALASIGLGCYRETWENPLGAGWYWLSHDGKCWQILVYLSLNFRVWMVSWSSYLPVTSPVEERKELGPWGVVTEAYRAD